MPAERSPKSLDRAVLEAGLPAGSRILIAVSGGPDSVALLDAFHRVVQSQLAAWELRVGHVNHELRSGESDRDEEFVCALASARGIPVDVARVDTIAHAQKRRLSLEAAARELRYTSLRDMLSEWHGDVIATGHTEDDQAETLLLHLLRGAGLRGLGGMAPFGGAVVRPFLGLPRSTILETLEERGIEFRFDTSNQDERHRRNLIRWRLIPNLQSIQPAIVPVLARSAGLLRADAEFLAQRAHRARQALNLTVDENEVSASTGVWRALHPALQRAVIRDMIELLQGNLVDVEEEHVSSLANIIRWEDDSELVNRLPHQIALYVDSSRFAVRIGPRRDAGPIEPVELSVPGSCATEVGTCEVAILPGLDRLTLERAIAVCGLYDALCDADALGDTLLVRSRRAGDRMGPIGLSGTRKLQDILVDRKVPRHVRNRIPVIQNADHIVWIPGIVLDGRVAVSPATVRVAHLRWRPYSPFHRATMPRYFAR